MNFVESVVEFCGDLKRNILELSNIVNIVNKAPSVQFLQQRGILYNPRICRNGHSMALQLRDKGDRWRCHSRQCHTEVDITERYLDGGIQAPDRSAATLLPITQDSIRPGTTVMSYLWGAYGGVAALGYNHLTVDHSMNLVDPQTGAHTRSIEGSWKSAKERNKRKN